MVEVGEAAVIAGHAGGGMRNGGTCNEQETSPRAEPVTERTHGGPGVSVSEDGDGTMVEAEIAEGGFSHPVGEAESEENGSGDEDGLEVVERGGNSGCYQLGVGGVDSYFKEADSDSEGAESESGSEDTVVDQESSAVGAGRPGFDPERRTRLEQVIVVPRVIQKRNDLAMAVIKSNWDGAAELGKIVYPRYKTVGKQTVVVRSGTPPQEALAIQERVMSRLVALELYCVGLPEANGNEIRWRLAATDGLVLDFCFQLKQASVLHWFPKGRGGAPQSVRGWPVDSIVPDKAPAGYPGGRGKFANECTRMAYVWVLSNTREGFEHKVLTLFDCSSFINHTEWTIRVVLKDPQDISCGWLSRLVDCPSVVYHPAAWRELFIAFFRTLSTSEPRLWKTYADRPFLELLEKLKSMPRLRAHRLVKGLGLANKTETFVRAVLVISAREKAQKGKKRPWTLTTLRAFVTRAMWLEDLADVYLTYVLDTISVFGQSYDLRYHNEPKIDQLCTRYYRLHEQPDARILKKTAGDRYCHEQVFVLESDVDAVSREEKMGILAGYGGTYTLARYGKRVNPGTTLASSMVGWHSGKDVARMRKECQVIGAREHDVGGVTYFSPDVNRDHGKDARKIGRMEQLYRSWENGSWRKRCQKYLATEPFSQGFIFKEPLKERAVGRRVQVYFPKHEKSHWGDVTSYDPETEYYRVTFEDGAPDDMVWPQLIGYIRQPPRSTEAARQARLARRKRTAASKSDVDVAKKKAKRARYNEKRKEKRKEVKELKYGAVEQQL